MVDFARTITNALSSPRDNRTVGQRIAALVIGRVDDPAVPDNGRARGSMAIRPASQRVGSANNPIGVSGVVHGPGQRELTDSEVKNAPITNEAARRLGEASARLSNMAMDAPVIPADRLVTTPGFSELPMGVTAVIGDRASPLHIAGDATGASVEFMERTSMHESGGNSFASPGTSSALGIFQFIESTWLDQFARHGRDYGQGELVSRMRRNRDGSWTAPPEVRDRILSMRTDDRWSALLGGHLTQENAEFLRSRLRRPIYEGEVYLAHFAGPDAATALIRAATSSHSSERNRTAASIMGRAAAQANERIFYVGEGRHRRPATAREVYDRQTRDYLDEAGRQRPYTGRVAVARPKDADSKVEG